MATPENTVESFTPEPTAAPAPAPAPEPAEAPEAAPPSAEDDQTIEEEEECNCRECCERQALAEGVHTYWE